MFSSYDDGPDNATRAHWALVGLEAFGQETGQNYFDGSLDVGDDALLEVGGDFLADLFHLARRNDVDPEQVIQRGLMHFEAEVQEEGDESQEGFEASPCEALRVEGGAEVNTAMPFTVVALKADCADEWVIVACLRGVVAAEEQWTPLPLEEEWTRYGDTFHAVDGNQAVKAALAEWDEQEPSSGCRSLEEGDE